MKYIKLVLGLGFLLFTFNAYAFISAPSPIPPSKITTNDNVTNIYFPDEIRDFDTGFAETLNTAKPGQQINIYLAGVGGSGAVLMRYAYLLKHTKATVTMRLESNVYSAHALLAVLGHDLTVNNNATAMFHAISGKGMEKELCSQYKPKKKQPKALDRGKSAYKKCLKSVQIEVANFDRTLRSYSENYLSDEELKTVEDGYEVYVPASVLKQRWDCFKQTGMKTGYCSQYYTTSPSNKE